MNKEEKIKEIYGSRYIALKDSINCNGWINQNVTTRALFDSLEFDEKTNSMRPLKLKGIENNNGWIKIESENDLPKEKMDVYVIRSGEIENHTFYIFETKENNDAQNEDWIKLFTHYQPIQKPQPPIY